MSLFFYKEFDYKQSAILSIEQDKDNGNTCEGITGVEWIRVNVKVAINEFNDYSGLKRHRFPWWKDNFSFAIEVVFS